MIRKIMSKEEKEARESRGKVIMGIILAVIMLFSTAGYFVFDFSNSKSSSGTIEYNGVKFAQQTDGTWSFSYGGNNYITLFNPKDTENISVITGKKVSNYYNLPLYISAEPIEDISSAGEQEILKNISGLTSRNNFACLSEDCSQNYPIKNCSSSNIIIFKQSSANLSIIRDNEKCVIIEYAPGEAERASDAFLFGIMGIK